MNDYEAKQAARKARLAEKAQKLREASQAFYGKSHGYVAGIPAG